jgi:hypothetical protein
VRPADNPFRVQRVDALAYRVAGGLEALADRFDSLGRRAAVVGPHGGGKTALLAALEPVLRARALRPVSLRLHCGDRRLGPEGERWLAVAAPGVVLVLDGSDELGRGEWLRVLWRSRAAAGLLVATHRRGWLPTLHRCEPAPALLRELMAELDAGCGCTLPAAAVLFARHRGNLRLALRELYDLHALR